MINNKLIEDFMHSKPENFHNSWDLLMQVVEKIESLDLSKYMYKWVWEDEEMNYNFNYIDFEISSSLISVYIELDLDPPIRIHSIDMFKEHHQGNKITKLEAVYECIIEFIKYYNKICKQNY